MPDQRKGRRWSYTAGTYGSSVRVYEQKRDGIIYAAAAGRDGREIRRSLGHRDRDKAIEYAERAARELREGLGVPGDRPTLRRIFAAYERDRTPDKAPRTQSEDRRQMAMFRKLWGDDFDLSRLSRGEWDRFIRRRRSGEISARGERVPPADRRQIKHRTIERDLKFLRAVCRWATRYRDASGRFLLEEDPSVGFDLPKERNPRRPVATHDRVDAIRAVYDEIQMHLGWEGPPEARRRVMAETYLPQIFELVVGTGRRIGAVLSLRVEDLELERSPAAPHGAIRWPEDTDKQGKAWRAPITSSVRAAIDTALLKRRRVGHGPLFPAPKNPDKPVRYELASKWLRKAEKAAELDPQPGTLWHAYRRLWVTVRKDLPDVDVAQAGGWSSLAALKQAYQQPDERTLLRVVEHSEQLREVR